MLQEDGDDAGEAIGQAHEREGDERKGARAQTTFWPRTLHAKMMVTTSTSTMRTRNAAVRCLVTSPCITESGGSNISIRGALNRWDSSSEVCCIKLDRVLLVNRKFIGSNGVVWGV